MVVRHHVVGYKEFCNFLENYKPGEEQVLHVYFTGSKSPSGTSWCEDCVRAAPVIEAAVEKADSNSHFLYVEVGDRPTWKDINCAFRKDPRTKLMVIPTLMRWEAPQKLVGGQCENVDLVEMLFTDE